jgi:hypothetical protein
MAVYKELTVILIGLFIGVVAISIFAFVPSKSDKAKYTITSENGKTYYADTFRVYGRGVMFDDIYGSTIIVQGDLEIKCKKTE